MENMSAGQPEIPDEFFDAERQLNDFVIYDRHWYRQAACKEADSEEFYVHQSPANRPDDANRLKARYCMQCLVRHDCLVEAIIAKDVDHAIVLGGLTRSERRVVRRRYLDQQKVTPKHRRLLNYDEERVANFLRRFFNGVAE